MKGIEISGFRIDDSGCYEGGILSSYWEFKGTMFFEDEEEKKEFEQGLIDLLVPYSGGSLSIISFEDLKKESDFFEMAHGS